MNVNIPHQPLLLEGFICNFEKDFGTNRMADVEIVYSEERSGFLFSMIGK